MLGTFSYNNLVSINIPANEGEVELLFTDNENQCTHSQTIGPLITCSEGCTLIINEIKSTCQDNGTPFDPTDDSYLITLDVNAEYGSSTNSYNVAINGVQSHTFIYDQVVNFMLPADGNNVTLTVSDTEDPTCLFTEQIGPLEACSDDCEIYPEYTNVRCDNNGTVVNNDDDVFYFDLEVSGLNVSTTYSIIELSYTGSYDVLTEFGPFKISEGSIQLTIVNADSSCTSTIEIAPPMACSDCNQTISINNPDEITCVMPEVELLVTASETATYQWSGPNGFSSTFDKINVDLPGWYEVIVSFSDGCTQIDSIEVISNNDIPLVVLGPDLLLNCAITQGTLDASNSTYATGAQFAWSDESGNIISTNLVTTVDQAGKYFFVIEDPITGCTSEVGEIEVIVDNNEPLVEIFADPDSIINCYWESINLSYLEEPNVIYEWIIDNQNIVSNMVTVTNSAKVTLISLDTISGCENSSEFNVEDLKEYPFIILEQDEIDCENGEVCIDGSNSPFAADLLFEWYDDNGNLIAENQEILCVNVGGDYTLELTDEINGCKNSESMSVMTPIIPCISLPETVTINSGMEGQIKVNIDGPLDEISEIIWSPSDALLCNDCVNNKIINPTDNLIVEVEVISISGCSMTASTTVIIKKIVEVYLPNAINVNSASGNSHFTLYGNDQVERIEKFSIYDRWGNLVFYAEDIEPNNPQLGWDGTFNGKAVQQGVYVYQFKILTSSGKNEEYIGTLTLLK
jgi:gliding motility-associated-like protein